MNKEPVNRELSNLLQEELRVPDSYIVWSVAMIALAVSPAFICACIAHASGHWDLFERSGSVITMIGLLLASRPYFEHTVTDLVIAHADEDAVLKPGEVLSDILAAKRGLTLSAFGSLIWGWGSYLRWWSFSLLAIWMVFVVYRACRDPVLQRRREDVL
ncbi:hypothetical protein AB4Y35_25300 [Paraburkholderia sp. EG286A]|uniref:hypothetical protein n=1 Tax=unclassified Paraburkholderia TaxID=2615204 RepID=UPI0034D260A5